MKLRVFVVMMILAASAYAQSSGFGPPTFNCHVGDLYQDNDYLGVSWKCGPNANEWVPTPAFEPWGGSGGGSGVTLSNTYASPGSFTFAHNLNSKFYQIHCWVYSGGSYSPATWTDFPVDANDATVTVSSAGTYVCSFNSSGSYSPPTQDFSVAVSPSSQTFWPTMTGTQTTPAYTVTQSAIGGYTGTANYTASGLASGMSAAYSPTSITGAGTSSLTLSFPANQAAATTGFTVQGSDGTNTHTANPSITIGNINSGLVECWPMTDGSGTTFADGCGTGNTETLAAGTITWGSYTGLPGTTPLFNLNAYAAGTNQTATNFSGSTSFSVAVWLAGCCSDAQSAFISTLDTTSNDTGWEFGVTSSGGNSTPYFYLISTFSPANYIQVKSTTAFDGTVPHYLVVTYDGSKSASGIILYVDGVAQTNSIVQNTLTGSITNARNAALGGRVDGSDTAVGAKFAYMRIYNRALSSSDVSNYYAQGAR